jgi:hypothetical protein
VTGQHREVEMYNGEERREHVCDPGEYIKKDDHDKDCKAGEIQKVMWKGVGGLVLLLLGIAGFLIINGGFARQADMTEIKIGINDLKHEVKAISEKQTAMEKRYEEVSVTNMRILSRMEKNGGHK